MDVGRRRAQGVPNRSDLLLLVLFSLPGETWVAAWGILACMPYAAAFPQQLCARVFTRGKTGWRLAGLLKGREGRVHIDEAIVAVPKKQQKGSILPITGRTFGYTVYSYLFYSYY